MTDRRIHIAPAVVDGKPLVVRDPESRKPLLAAGERKVRTRYWLRRLADGSVVEVRPVTPAAVKARPKAAEKES